MYSSEVNEVFPLTCYFRWLTLLFPLLAAVGYISDRWRTRQSLQQLSAMRQALLKRRKNVGTLILITVAITFVSTFYFNRLGGPGPSFLVTVLVMHMINGRHLRWIEWKIDESHAIRLTAEYGGTS